MTLSVAGLFAGIGGIELGLARSGHRAELLSEIEPHAVGVLRAHFPDASLDLDVRLLRRLPPVDLVTAGFPCQDLSQAGRKRGIGGKRSGLVGEVFRLVAGAKPRPRWLLFENVSYMLRLDRGRAMRVLVDELEDLGYLWAYRTVDARAFGLPQRRQRVVLLASRKEDPRSVLFADDSDREPPSWGMANVDMSKVYGFYWTEGLRGIGWTQSAVPTIKGGSTIGIPSPPAIWVPAQRFFGLPEIRDVERLQGFPVNWTRPAESVTGRGNRARWGLVGNAVPVPVSRWLGRRLNQPGTWDPELQVRLSGSKWPASAWGASGKVFEVHSGMYPLHLVHRDLGAFLRYELTPLSNRAATGFLRRAVASQLRYPQRFLDDMERFITNSSEDRAA